MKWLRWVFRPVPLDQGVIEEFSSITSWLDSHLVDAIFEFVLADLSAVPGFPQLFCSLHIFTLCLTFSIIYAIGDFFINMFGHSSFFISCQSSCNITKKEQQRAGIQKGGM